jgi:hypothetical protein
VELVATLLTSVNTGFSLVGRIAELAGSTDPGHRWLRCASSTADQCLTTPATGPRNRYVSVDGRLGDVVVRLLLHDYQADAGGADLGDEWGVRVSMPLPADLGLVVKDSDYSGTTIRPDVSKLWVMLNFAL